MHYQITLSCSNDTKQIENPWSKALIECVNKNPLLTSHNHSNPLEAMAYTHKGNIRLLLKNQKIQGATENPVDEIHAWLTRLLMAGRIPFIVNTINEIPLNKIDKFFEVKKRKGKKNRRLESAPKIEIPYPNEKHIDDVSLPSTIPGYQVVCRLNSSIFTGLDTSTIKQQVSRLINSQLHLYPMTLRSEKCTVTIPSLYLHTLTNKAIIFVVPCDQLDLEGASALVLNHMQETYQNVFTLERCQVLYFRDNCFRPTHRETSNTQMLRMLGIDLLGETYSEYICPLSECVMDHPVELPSTKTVVDMGSIQLHLALRGTNPYTNEPMSHDQIKERPKLKKKIDTTIHRLVKEKIEIGVSAFQDKDYNAAIDQLERVVVYTGTQTIPNPEDHSRVLFHLAQAHRLKQRKLKAIRYTEKLILHSILSDATLEDQAAYLVQLAELYQQMNRPDIGDKYSRMACELRPPCVVDQEHTETSGGLSEMTHLPSSASKSSLLVDEKLTKKHRAFFNELLAAKARKRRPIGRFSLEKNLFCGERHRGYLHFHDIKLILNSNHEELKKINSKHDIPKNFDRILLSLLRNINYKCICVSTSFRFQSDLIKEIQIGICLFVPNNISAPSIGSGSFSKRLIEQFFEKQMDFFPQIGATTVEYGDKKILNVSMPICYAQPIIKEMISATKVLKKTYVFANTITLVNSPLAPRQADYLKNADIIVTENRHDGESIQSCIDKLQLDLGEGKATCMTSDKRSSILRLARFLNEIGNAPAARNYFESVIKLDRDGLSTDESSLENSLTLACSLLEYGLLHRDNNDIENARVCFSESLKLYRRAESDHSDLLDKISRLINRCDQSLESETQSKIQMNC